jgi:SAM-dependent methyltransferase
MMLVESNLVYAGVACHICGEKQLNLFPTYPALPRIASDCVPWRSGGKLATCESCLCVQNPVDDHWHTETNAIYGQYKIYTQSAGSEQGVVSDSNQLSPRSAKVFQHSAPYLNLKKDGYLLDIGCANGALLRCFSKIAPTWKMVGFEIDDKRRKEVESIPGVEQFASGSLDKIARQFDIITLIHVFEHLQNPQQWLNDLRRLLKPNGLVIIQVPDPKTNPYNLLVADHCSHFLMPDLINIAQNAGYEVITYSDKWVAREFSIIIKPATKDSKLTASKLDDSLATQRATTYPENSLNWLYSIIDQAKSISNDKPRGIWGTAIAATWLYSLMDNNVDFFVDEDPSRIGQTHLGKPIYSPEMIPKNSNVFIALTPEIASSIYNRWSKLDATLHMPPSLSY